MGPCNLVDLAQGLPAQGCEHATREEVLETLGMAAYMGAGPSVMYASHAIEAFDQLAAEQSGATKA